MASQANSTTAHSDAQTLTTNLIRRINDAEVLRATIRALPPCASVREAELTQLQAEIWNEVATGIELMLNAPPAEMPVRLQAEVALALGGPEWGREEDDWLDHVARRVLERAANDQSGS